MLWLLRDSGRVRRRLLQGEKALPGWEFCGIMRMRTHRKRPRVRSQPGAVELKKWINEDQGGWTMELSISGRQRRAAQITKAAPQRKTAGPGTVLNRAGRDKTAWSQAALSFLQEVNRQDLEKQRKLLEAKQRGGGELDMLEKSLKVMDKCRKIASRIMRGDKVPPQDERYLMECDPDGYKLALACRKPKEKPKEWESVLDEEDRASSEGAGGEAAVDSGAETAE